MPPEKPVSTSEVRRTGPEHFSPLADLRTPPGQVPPCARCGAPSLGANPIAITPPVWDLEFLCEDCGGKIFPVMSCALYPNYRVVMDNRAGHLRVIKLTRDEALARVQPKRPGKPAPPRRPFGPA